MAAAPGQPGNAADITRASFGLVCQRPWTALRLSARTTAIMMLYVLSSNVAIVYVRISFLKYLLAAAVLLKRRQTKWPRRRQVK